MNLVDDLSIAICEQIDIIKIVHEHGVVLEKAGNKYKGICPFHPDKKPSFTIYPETGTFYCFGCQQAGNAINFYAKKNNLSYNQAKQHLAEKLGLKRPGNNKSSSGPILQGCTLQEYAELKQIPIEHLKSFGLKETTYKEKSAILIPYMDEDGKTVSVQYRTALRKSDNMDERFKFKKGSHVFLYGVWRIKDHSNYDYMVIVEGASDCHTLWYSNIQAVGIPGAASWKEEWAVYLDKFESVYVWIEPDAGGKSALKAFQNSILRRKMKTISHDKCKDPSELYLKDKNNFVEYFWKILTDAKPLPETENTETLKMIDDIEQKFNEIKDPGILNYPLTDCGNAERFVKLFGDKFCYVRNRGKWLNFRDVRWVDADDSVRLAVRDVARILGKTSFMADDNKQITDILKWAKASESIAKIGAALDLARCHLSHNIDEFDKNPMALTCRNGIVDLETGKLLKAEPKNFSYRFVDIDYDENAECPNFQSILRDIFCRNDELIDFIQRAIGYSLTGLTSEQCIFICYGSGANGKSTFLRCLQYIAGDYYATTPSSTFRMNFKDDRIPNDLARLFGVRLVLWSEISEGTRLHEERIKAMTGGDIISSRFLHQERFDYRLLCLQLRRRS
ncbi:MAG: phage/plasmid primase, P4 family [Candidatus Hodarchaeota archaeon]